MPREECEIWNSGNEAEYRWLEIHGTRAEDKQRGEAFAITRDRVTFRKGKRIKKRYVFNRATVATTSPGELIPPAAPEPGNLMDRLKQKAVDFGLRNGPEKPRPEGGYPQAGTTIEVENRAGTIYLEDENTELVIHRLTPGLFFSLASEAATKALLTRLKIPLYVWIIGGLAGAGVMYTLQNFIKAWRFGT